MQAGCERAGWCAAVLGASIVVRGCLLLVADRHERAGCVPCSPGAVDRGGGVRAAGGEARGAAGAVALQEAGQSW